MRRVFNTAALLAATVAAGSVPAIAEESPLPNADYGVSRIWQLGGVGGWNHLALEPNGSRLFISRGDRVDVVGTASGRRLGTVVNTNGARGIAFAPELKRGYTSNGRANSVTEFELDTLHVTQETTIAGKSPDAILYEPRGQHVFVANSGSNDIDVLDPSTLEGLAAVPLPGRPGFMVTDATGTVFVNVRADVKADAKADPGRLVAIDAKTFKIKANWPLPECSNPSGLALDAPNHRLFSVCENQRMVVTDSLTGKPVARLMIGQGADTTAYDGELGFVFSANGDEGTLTVIHEDSPDKFRVIATVQTQRSAGSMALDPGTHRIFLAAARLGDSPAPTQEQPHPRPAIVPDSFVVLVAEPK